MLKGFIIIAVFAVAGCSAKVEQKAPVAKTILPKELKEISGITAAGSDIWAITDKPHAEIYKLDLKGNLVEKVTIANAEATDVEAVASDSSNIYLGDVGDNNGDRQERTVFKVARRGIPAGKEATVKAEQIIFTFPGNELTEKKKTNKFDCESLMSYKDSLYVFTKDREDDETALYVLPKTPGKYVARYISSFNSKGLVTDAAINQQGNELALIGYHKGHQHPFIILFSKFTGTDFFSGDHHKVHLTDSDWDWQLEGITYGNDNMVYFSCEGTDQVPATFYGIKREHLLELEKKNKPDKKQDEEKDNDDDPEMSTKGKHLKF